MESKFSEIGFWITEVDNVDQDFSKWSDEALAHGGTIKVFWNEISLPYKPILPNLTKYPT